MVEKKVPFDAQNNRTNNELRSPKEKSACYS